MMISARCPPTGWPKMAYGPMSYAAGSPVRTLVTPGKVPDWMENDPAYGANMPGSLARYDRDTSLWKTSQLCLDGGLATFSETWPRSGMMRSGTAYRLPPLARLTAATASGLWFTPHGMGEDGHGSELSMAARVSVGLSDSERSKTKTPRQHWPTPTAEDGESKGMSAKRLATRDPDKLATAVRFASPAARDYRSGKGRSKNGHTPQLPEQVGGQLNPTWVEWLMGLPLEWTVVRD